MEDNQIVDLYWARSESAIMETASKYGKYCHAIAYNILCDQEDADESVNDTYLGAWNAMPPHRPSILRSFLGKITRRVSLKKWRDSHRDKRGGGEVSLALDELSECVPSNVMVEDEIMAAELSKALSPICQLRKGKSFSAATGIWTLSSKSAQTLVLASVK